MPTLEVYNKQGKKSGKLELKDEIFTPAVNRALLYQAIVKYRAGQRQGTLNTKERGDVSGGGKKPWRQKGTGRARQGSSRSPLWVGGGVTFGPHPRDFNYTLPKKMLRGALRESLNAKFQSGDLICLNDLTDPMSKTKEFATLLKTLNRQGKILAVLDGSDSSLQRITRNLPRFSLRRAADVNAYDILRHKTLIVTKTAWENLLKRIDQ